MKVTVNGEIIDINEGTTLTGLLKEKGLEPERVVVEYNREITKK